MKLSAVSHQHKILFLLIQLIAEGRKLSGMLQHFLMNLNRHGGFERFLVRRQGALLFLK